MKHLKRIKKPIVLISLFLTFTVCFYAPLSIYILNNEEFWFNLRVIWYVPTLFFLVSFGAIVFVGQILKGKLEDAYLGVLFGLGFCFYMQGNFLSLHVGIFNGNQILWEQYRTKMIVNLVLWAIIILACIVLFLWKDNLLKKVAMYASALLFSVQFISFVVILVPLLAKGNFQTPLLPTLTTKGLYEVGDQENIVVFIMDSYDEAYFQYVLDNEPQIVEKLDGFVFYDNFTSSFPTTLYSVLSMIGGKTFKNEMPRLEWVEANSENRLYFDELIDRGYTISLYTSELESIPQRIRDVTDNYAEIPLRFYNVRTCFSLLYRMSACQYFPDIVKPYVWLNSTLTDSTATTDSEYPVFSLNNALYKYNLDQQGITVNSGSKEYKFIHLYGAHEPYYIDEWGNEGEQTWDWTIPAKGCLRMMIDYMDRLKQEGVYDQTTIIFTADHGNNGYVGVMSAPVFLIKEKYSKGELKTCSTEAGLVNYGATIADLCGTEDLDIYGDSILRMDENTRFDRYYYQFVYKEGDWRPLGYDGNFYLVEYLTPYNNNETAQFKLTDIEYTPAGKTIPHKKNCETCLRTGGIPEDYDRWDWLEHIHVSDFSDDEQVKK